MFSMALVVAKVRQRVVGQVQPKHRTFVDTPPSYGCMAPLTCYEFTEAIDMFDATSVPPAARHGFLLAPPAAPMMNPSPTAVNLTVKAQTQAVTFLALGHL